jgi:hypothetical protein
MVPCNNVSLLKRENNVSHMVLPLLAILLCRVAVSASAAADVEDSDPLQFSIDAVTRADNCLYMLQSTRDPDTGDCQALRDFHERRFLVWSPDLGVLDATLRRRVVGNQQIYLQTLEDIEQETQRLR